MTGPAEEALFSAIMETRQQIDFLWQFFVSVHIAIFALLLLYNHAVESLNAAAKFFAMGAIAAFEWINGNALSGAYVLLDAMLEQYRMSFGQAEQFVLASYESRPVMVLITHSSALLIVLLAFLSRRFIQAKAPATDGH